jgi:peroxiredoxin Q/BCP
VFREGPLYLRRRVADLEKERGARMALNEYDPAPDFELPDQDGRTVRLSDFKGRWVLVYFYPKDDTPGCTKEACSIQEKLPRFDKSELVVLGISPDSVASHKKFADKFRLSFRLLADEERKVVQRYGVWGSKTFMGKDYMGVTRSSVLVDDKGRVAKIYPKVDPEVHAEEVLKDLETLAVKK